MRARHSCANQIVLPPASPQNRSNRKFFADTDGKSNDDLIPIHHTSYGHGEPPPAPPRARVPPISTSSHPKSHAQTCGLPEPVLALCSAPALTPPRPSRCPRTPPPPHWPSRTLRPLRMPESHTSPHPTTPPSTAHMLPYAPCSAGGETKLRSAALTAATCPLTCARSRCTLS